MEHFAGYGFNKSHSTAYAFLAYQTAYLKANYPWHFAAALLTIEAQNTDKLALYLGECRDRGIPVLPPDINESQLRFTVEPGKGVRFGLTAIKNVGEGAIESLLEVRKKQGRITSLDALCEDLDLRLVNKRVFESLTKAGAFDSLAQGHAVRGAPVSGAPAAADRRRRCGVRARRAACSATANDGQAQLFGGVRRRADRRHTAPATATLPDAAPWTETEQLAFEKETLGLYWSGHPVDRYADALQAASARRRSPNSPRRRPTPTAPTDGGRADASRSSPTRRRRHRRRLPAAEDAQGRPDGGLHARGRAGRRRDHRVSRRLPARGGLIETGTLVLVRGKLERDDETVRILATEIAPLESVRERLAREVAIHLKTPADRDMLEALGEIFSRHRGDRKVSFELETGRAANRLRVRVDVSSQIRVRPSPALDRGSRAGGRGSADRWSSR